MTGTSKTLTETTHYEITNNRPGERRRSGKELEAAMATTKRVPNTGHDLNAHRDPDAEPVRFGTVQTVGGGFGYLWRSAANTPGTSGPVVLASGWTTDAEELRTLIHPKLRPQQVEPGNAATIDRAIARWSDGELAALDEISVEQQSGPFLSRAWQVLRTVRGTVSYAEFAELAGNPRASRAAANACARNAAALFVPCHRVLRTDGTLGGFRYGVEVKRAVLAHERR